MIVRLKGIKRVRSKGHVYYYHRATMTRLHGEPDSPQFLTQLRELDNSTLGTKLPGTLGRLLAAYRAAPEFTELALGSKREYQKGMAALRAVDAVPLAALTVPRLYELRDRIMSRHSRSTANRTIALLRLVFAWGIKRGLCQSNPAIAVEKIRRPKDAKVVNRRWRDNELEIVLNEAPAWMQVPIAIAAFTGMRESDVVRVTWKSYDGCEFETRQLKTGNPIWIPAHYRLRAILDAARRIGPQIVVGVRGRPMSANSFGSRFFEFIARLREAGKVEPGLSFHGLRHTLGTRLAEAGCDPATIAAVLGQKTTKMAEHYSRTARRHHLATAAIERIEEHDLNKVGKHDGKLSSKTLS